jgi:hypothetical protein
VTVTTALAMIAFLVLLGWQVLRGDSCCWCGREGCDTCGWDWFKNGGEKL